MGLLLNPSRFGAGTPPVLTYAQQVLADNPIGYWKLDETAGTTAADSSGNGRDMTVSGSVTLGAAAIRPNSPRAFDFTGGYLSRAYDAGLNANSHSWEAWVNADAVSSYRAILARDGNSGSRGPTLYVQGGILDLYTGGNDVVAARTLAIGGMYHVVATYDYAAQLVCFYVNGVLDVVRTGWNIPISALNGIYIGASPAGTGAPTLPFDGKISDVAYYTTTLSALRVAEHYRAAFTDASYLAAVTADTPAAQYRLGDLAGTTMTDSSGNGRDGTYANVTLGTTGLIPGDTNKAVTLSKAALSRGVVTYGAWMNSPTALTVEALLQCPDYTAEQHIGDRDLGGQRSFIFRVYQNKLEVYKAPGGAEVYAQSLRTLVDGVKYHLAFTYDGTAIRLYINGTLDRVVAAAGTLPSTSSDLAVGASRLGGGGFAGLTDGIEDEYAYYTSVLTPQRIAAHAAQALSSTGPDAYTTQVLADSPWGFWRTNEASGTTLADVSPNNRPMTTVNSPTLAQSGPTAGVNDAILFSGSGPRAGTAATTNAAVFTCEAWVYITAAPGALTAFLTRSVSVAGTDPTDGILSIDTAGKVQWQVYNGANQIITSPAALTLNTWHHVVGSVGAAGMKLRIDKTTVVSNGGVTGGYTGSNQGIYLRAGATAWNGGGTMKIARPAYYTTQLLDARTDAHYDAA